MLCINIVLVWIRIPLELLDVMCYAILLTHIPRCTWCRPTWHNHLLTLVLLTYQFIDGMTKSSHNQCLFQVWLGGGPLTQDSCGGSLYPVYRNYIKYAININTGLNIALESKGFTILQIERSETPLPPPPHIHTHIPGINPDNKLFDQLSISHKLFDHFLWYFIYEYPMLI